MTKTTQTLALAFLFSALPLLSQTAQVVGRITDASGAAIPGAAISIRNEATGLERRSVSNESGLYTVPLLPTGAYAVQVTKDGFRGEVRTGVVLEVDQRAELNFTLTVGAVSEKIEVSAAVSRLNTVEASQGQVIDNQRIVEMPLNGRNYIDLALMSGGAVQSAPGARVGGFSAGGQRATQNNYLMDGIDNNQVEIAAAGRRAEMVAPSIDAIQEFKVQTNAYSAEFGRAMGAVVNLTIKSGTNELHGTAFEFVRNQIFDARNFFTPPNVEKPTFKRNQYGMSLGGPVFLPKIYDGRNKTFFFGDFESTRIRETATIGSNIPTMRMRQGDFGELPANRNILDYTNGQPFPNRVIPASRFDPVGRRLIELYPVPQNSNLANNFINLAPRNQDTDRWDVRVDQNISGQDNLFFRFSSQYVFAPNTPNLPPPAFGGGGLDFNTQGYNTGLGWNHVFTPNLIGSARLGWNYASFARNNPREALGRNFNQEFGIPGATILPDGAFSQMNITGYRALGLGAFNPVTRNSQNRQASGDITWVAGRHTVKAGSSFIRSQNPIKNINTAIGGFTFNGAYSTDGAADFLMGNVNQWNWQSPLDIRLFTYNLGLFIQDDFKVSQKLTLNLGLRYELSPPVYEANNQMANFDIDTDPNNPQVVVARSGGSRFDRALVATDKNNFMTRLGLAYKLTPKTVLRTGYGHFFSYLEGFGDGEFLTGSPPFSYGVVLPGTNVLPVFPLSVGPPPGSTDISRATGLTLRSYERNALMPNAHQWNFNIQREIGLDWLLEIGYSGSRGIHLVRQYDGNFSPAGPGNINAKRPYTRAAIPGTAVIASPLGSITSHRLDGNSNYHAMLAKVEKRFSSGFTVLSSYTWSKNIGDTCGNASAGNTAGCGYQNLFELRPERSLDNQDVPHRFVTSALYDLPFGKGRPLMANAHPVVNGVLGGWSIGSIVTVSSLTPFSPTVQGNPTNSGTISVVQRPNVAGDAKQGQRTLERDFNTDAFVRQPNFTYGNAGRNILRGRPVFNWDFSALKTFQIVERVRLQFRFEAFNFTNTPRFFQPGNVLGAANFGVITGADTPRNLQFALKLIW